MTTLGQRSAALLWPCLLCAAPIPLAPAPGAEPEYPPLKADPSGLGKNVQRTMRLLAASTPEQRNTVRVLFYGQSITEQGWARAVADDLRRRFPHADLVVENRALGGFSSQLLVKTAEADLYPFEPDLVVFHVYGAHDKYEDIVRRVRERTTAEVLQQNDHVTKPADLAEETDPKKLPPKGEHWDAFMNHNWLPAVSAKYGTELCDQRALWKRYLTANKLEPRALLRDGVHLNAHGEFLMAECVKAYLRHDPAFGPSPAEAWVKTLAVGTDASWVDGKLRVEFDGTRVDAIYGPKAKGSAPAPAAVTIDGKKPTELPGTLAPTRALATPGGKWPVVAGFGWEKPPVAEDWTMEVKKDAADAKVFAFTLSGSVTGPDGAGRSDKKFVSNSGRVAIEPGHWQADYALALAGVKPVPDAFTVRWKVVPHAVDAIPAPGGREPAAGTAVTLARGLLPGKHVLEIAGGPGAPIAAIRVHRPPLAGAKK
ncbi:SGNH/GDSL hydrolase family protein [Gemmata sp.]|uniref:SGNH/GDSL hydrolase family protein n=1 Tax=Gemmata sp. TaxID=1914242 RepID=UPI003F71E3DF